MSARKAGLLAAIAALLCLGPRWVRAQGAYRLQAVPDFQTQGRDPVSFNVTCSSYTWTVFKSSDTIGRAVFVQNPSTSTSNIGIIFADPTYSAPTVSYDTTTAGIDLSAGAAIFTDATRAAGYCRVPVNAAAQHLKGYWNRDRGDYGQIGDPTLQR